MNLHEELIAPEIRLRNKRLGTILSVLAIMILIGSMFYMGLTHYNPFDKPAIDKKTQGSW